MRVRRAMSLGDSMRKIAAMQREILGRSETRFVRPALENRTAFQQIVQPGQVVTADSRKQHQVRTARDDINRVDLQ